MEEEGHERFVCFIWSVDGMKNEGGASKGKRERGRRRREKEK